MSPSDTTTPNEQPKKLYWDKLKEYRKPHILKAWREQKARYGDMYDRMDRKVLKAEILEHLEFLRLQDLEERSKRKREEDESHGGSDNILPPSKFQKTSEPTVTSFNHL